MVAQISNTISEFFVQNTHLKHTTTKGELIRIGDLARWARVAEQELREIINQGVSVSYQEREWRTNHVVFCNENLCGLDTEEYVVA